METIDTPQIKTHKRQKPSLKLSLEARGIQPPVLQFQHRRLLTLRLEVRDAGADVLSGLARSEVVPNLLPVRLLCFILGSAILNLYRSVKCHVIHRVHWLQKHTARPCLLIIPYPRATQIGILQPQLEVHLCTRACCDHQAEERRCRAVVARIDVPRTRCAGDMGRRDGRVLWTQAHIKRRPRRARAGRIGRFNMDSLRTLVTK